MVRDSLITDPQIAEPLKLAEQADIAVVGIGTLLPDSTLVQSECIFTDAEIEWLRQLNCVGDIALQFFDNDGRKVFTPLDQRIIGLTRDQMQRIGRVIGVAGGMDKLAAIRGALRGKWLHVLVTNEEVALTLLREVEGENPAVEPKQEVVNADE
jgi:lsr operon transcriptional repressor